MTNLLYQLFTIDNQDPDMVRSSFENGFTWSHLYKRNGHAVLQYMIMDFHALTFAGLIRGSFHSEGNFESSPPHGEVDPKADRKRVTIVLLLAKWAFYVLKFH